MYCAVYLISNYLLTVIFDSMYQYVIWPFVFTGVRSLFLCLFKSKQRTGTDRESPACINWCFALSIPVQ